MSGASKETQRVEYINGNWTAGGSGFEILVVTEDEERHSLPIAPAEFAALVATMRPETTFLFDPETDSIIIANLVGQWIDTDWTRGAPRHQLEENAADAK